MGKKSVIIFTIIAVVVLDQILKVYIKTNFSYGGGFDILGLNWAKIHFIENEGMAFGLSFGGVVGKYVLSIFRIIMVGFLFYILGNLIRAKETLGLLVSFSLIIAGAIGNILDSMFYGLIFSESYMHGAPSVFLPEGGGYGKFLTGKVVDMFYFPLIETTLPEWIPFWGGEYFEFFRPVFNIADAAITTGVASILLFHRRFFDSKPVSTEDEKVEPTNQTTISDKADDLAKETQDQNTDLTVEDSTIQIENEQDEPKNERET